MTPNESLTRAPLKTPKAAAIAGIAFSVLQIMVFWLLRSSVPLDPQEPGSWLQGSSEKVALALNLMPFAGIAFLWFMGVVRDRLGQAEDRFFATVYFGSGLLYLAMLFVAAAMIGAILMAFYAQPQDFIGSPTFRFARAAAYNTINIYLTKMAAVFMFSTSTVAIYTRFEPRWLALSGYGMAVVLLFGSYFVSWSFAVFPAWVLLTSAYILLDNARSSALPSG